MNKQIENITDGLSHFTESAESFITTARNGMSEQMDEVAQKIDEGRQQAKGLLKIVRRKGEEYGSAVDQEMRDHSVRYLVIVAGIGAVLGYLFATNCASRDRRTQTK